MVRMEAAWTSETLVSEDGGLNFYRCENLKPLITILQLRLTEGDNPPAILSDSNITDIQEGTQFIGTSDCTFHAGISSDGSIVTSDAKKSSLSQSKDLILHKVTRIQDRKKEECPATINSTYNSIVPNINSLMYIKETHLIVDQSNICPPVG